MYRSCFLPSLSHHLASGRVEKSSLNDLDIKWRLFFRNICGIWEARGLGKNDMATNAFFYADRRIGGLGTVNLNEDADVWTIARATQLLSSKDEVVRKVCWAQLEDTIKRSFNNDDPIPSELPFSDYLSGSTDGCLWRMSYAHRSGRNLWSLARRAASTRKARIDVSDSVITQITVDDISCCPVKAVRGLRTAIRNQWSKKFLDCSMQGRVAAGLDLDPSSDMSRLVSCRTEIRIADWDVIHRARLDILPLNGYAWKKNDPRGSCRKCGQGVEITQHVTNMCPVTLSDRTKHHDRVLNMFKNLLDKCGISCVINSTISGSSLRPDVQLEIGGVPLIVDVTISFDTPVSLNKAYETKINRYAHFARMCPLVLGSLGSWHPNNDDIKSLLNISCRRWADFRRKSRNMTIAGSCEMIRYHFRRCTLEGPPLEEDESLVREIN